MHLPLTPDELIARLDDGPLTKQYNETCYPLHDHEMKNECIVYCYD